MIILASYADSIPSGKHSSLKALRSFLHSWVPPRVALHLLPFYPSDGDDGFAPSDWFSVNADLGDWSDIADLGNDRHLIVDGIYNHVGSSHQFVRDFFARPLESGGQLFTMKHVSLAEYPAAPRGGSVMRPHIINGEKWYIWQTFTADAFDINLEDDEVVTAIKRHLQWLKRHNVWGVRLDAPAYYGKEPGGRHRHSPKSIALTRDMVARVRSFGLASITQLDCEKRCITYFEDPHPKTDAIIDFSYPAQLAACLLERDPDIIVKHLKSTWNIGHNLIRYPRSHDGIYLRSDLTPPRVIESLIRAAACANFPVRVIDDRIYEINSSLPALLEVDTAKENVEARIDLAVAITSLASGWCYLYLPAVLGFSPEQLDLRFTDPRRLNRVPIPDASLQNFARIGRLQRLKHMLDLLSSVKGKLACKGDLAADAIHRIGAHGLCIRRERGRYTLVANLHDQQELQLDDSALGESIFSQRYFRHGLGPLGFAIFTHDPNVRHIARPE
ncbi:alpha-amylase family glycosyl hydrolase [Streptomyces sp. T028]|uniref:alpha-amylase family glycosyl hydrolase n=1 Tax=Streptomyces sp. T028 TaxID=3394379 RepID=UPI003A87A3C7